MEAETLLDSRQLSRPGRRRLDVLIVDDVSRIFGPAAVAGAIETGIFVIGLFDQTAGLGRSYLEKLGAQLILPASTSVEELTEVVLRVGASRTPPVHDASAARPRPAPAGGRGGGGVVSGWFSSTGGCGLTETIVAVAEALSRQQRRVLVVETEPAGGCLAARLSRSPDSGLPWALGRVTNGLAPLPSGLSGPRADGTPAVGSFDLIGQTSMPGGPPLVSVDALTALIEQVRTGYDHVLVSAGPLVAGAPGAAKDRFAAGRTVSGLCDLAVAGAAADPLGAVELCRWRATAAEIGLSVPAWGFFGRAGRSRFEEAQLVDLVKGATGATSGGSFERLWFLPEDEVVARARWNGELVRRGRWHQATGHLAGALAGVNRAPGRAAADRVGAWGMVLSR